jgi:hypothetical protein
MKNPLLILGTCVIAAVALALSCTKNTNPQPPIHDTVKVVQNDTIYGTKPDPTVNLTKGLLLYLPFSGNIADSSGNNNPTQAIGSVLGYDGHGYANSAFTANGSGQYVMVTNNGSIKFDTAYSVSIDFMTLDVSSLHAYISMVNWSNAYGPTFVMGTTVPGYSTRFDVGANDTALHCDNTGVGNPTNLADTTNFTPQTSRWYNAILTYHRDSINIYINGALIASKVGTGHIANLCPSSSIVIGGWWQNDPQNVNGALDNVRLYNRVLTPHEIAALASNYQVTSNSIKPALKSN